VISEQGLRASQAQLARAKAQLELMQSGAWAADLEVARANVARAVAEVKQTETEIDRTVVRALVDGEVLQVNVRPGEFVGAPAGQALIVLGDLEAFHVRVDIDEYDIPRFQSGGQAHGVLKGWREIQFPLEFVRIEPYVIPKRSLTGDSNERVDTRVLQVIYRVNRGERPLYVGQQLDVYVEAAGAKSP
jgi:multidrug resistance efflux pump